MESQPLVSVIMPCYNMEKYISDAILSVRQQTYPHWELLIVDDASTDNTVNVIESTANRTIGSITPSKTFIQASPTHVTCA